MPAVCAGCGRVLESEGAPCPVCDTTMVQAGAGDGPLGSLAERFEFVQELGAGGMGRVDLARDKRLDRKVAIKRILDPENVRSSILNRFLREARAMAKFHHPGIVRIIDVGEDDLGAYIIMDFVEGEPLESVLRKEGRFPLPRAIVLARHLLTTLCALHDEGIIHRDIKPMNLILQRAPEGERPVLIDFGLARDDADRNLTMEGDRLGTLNYMAPEQFSDSSTVDERADLYAVGATLYRMLTGKVPSEIIRDEIPAEARGFTMRLLERSRQERPASARDALALLEQIPCEGVAPAPVPPPSAPPGATRDAPSAPPAATAGAQPSDASGYISRREDVPIEFCASCGGQTGAQFLECTRCQDKRRYCSDPCFDRHEAEEHCSECSRPLVSRYIYSGQLNAATGKDLRFCSSECRRRYERGAICTFCHSRLPGEAWHAEDINAAVGHQALFCSSACLNRYREEHLCAECGRGLGDRFLTCKACGGAGGFCSDACFEAHAAAAHPSGA